MFLALNRIGTMSVIVFLTVREGRTLLLGVTLTLLAGFGVGMGLGWCQL